MNHIKYRPTRDELTELRTFWEIWQGLPSLPFEDLEYSEGKESRRYKTNGHYIWVPHNALKAYQKDPKTLLLAMSEKAKIGKLKTRSLSPTYETLEASIKRARQHNQTELEKARKNYVINHIKTLHDEHKISEEYHDRLLRIVNRRTKIFKTREQMQKFLDNLN